MLPGLVVIWYKSTDNRVSKNLNTLIVIQPKNSPMKNYLPYRTVVIALVVLAALVVFPVFGIAYPPPTTPSISADNPIQNTTDVIATMAVKNFVSATVSSGSPPVGEPVTVSGRVTGGVLSEGVQIWVFAGNYVNVSNVPVNADGTFSRTYPTTGLPLATYYVYIQSPGENGMFNIDLEDAGIYSGQVINTRNHALIFNFTGTGSVQDAAASQALSDAINSQGVDDAYTKLTFPAGVPIRNYG